MKRVKLEPETFFPTKEELDQLANEGNYLKLVARLAEQTPENAQKEAFARRLAEGKDVRPYGIDTVRLVAVHMDVRELLALANKFTVFAIILKEDQFWKSKFLADFPFAAQIYGKELPDWTNEILQPNKWRTYYYMIRRFVYHTVFPRIAGIFSGVIWLGNDSAITVLVKNNGDLTFTISITISGTSYGDPVIVTYTQLLWRLQPIISTPLDSNPIVLCVKRYFDPYLGQNIIESDTLIVWTAFIANIRRPLTMRIQGYNSDGDEDIRKLCWGYLAGIFMGGGFKKDGKPLIGCSVCSKDASFRCNRCETIYFCGNNCYRDHKCAQ